MRTLIALSLLAVLGACQMAPPKMSDVGGVATASAFKKNTPEWRGHRFAINRCADCHSVDYAESSPLAQAPSFSAIANMPNLSSDTLGEWMKNHRNYPDEMYFEIPAEHIDDVVAYILTLRRDD